MFLSYRVKFRVRVRSGADVRDGSFRGGGQAFAGKCPTFGSADASSESSAGLYLVNAGEGANEERSGLDKCYLQTGERVAES